MLHKFSIIIPCYNEENTVFDVVNEICLKFNDAQVIVVDDGSTDKSLAELHKLEHSNLNILELTKNQGKGKAMRTGLDKAKTISDVVIFTDADKEILINDLSKVFDYYKNKNVDAVFGSRFLNISIKKIFQMGLHRYLANKTLTLITNMIYKQKLTDMETAVKSFKTSFIDTLELKSDGFDIEPEIVKALSKARVKINEIPINYEPRTSKEGKKISFKDGFITLIYLLRKRQ
jgi:glycosyltransferase involved in cell wall biosynthesis